MAIVDEAEKVASGKGEKAQGRRNAQRGPSSGACVLR